MTISIPGSSGHYHPPTDRPGGGSRYRAGSGYPIPPGEWQCQVPRSSRVVGTSFVVEVDSSGRDDAELISFGVSHDEEASIFVSACLLTTQRLDPVLDSTDVGTGDVEMNAGASNATSVKFLLFGGSYGYAAPVICTATLSYYGWVCSWNTTTVPDGSYGLVSEASGPGGTAYSSGVGITVDNPPPTTSDPRPLQRGDAGRAQLPPWTPAHRTPPASSSCSSGAATAMPRR